MPAGPIGSVWAAGSWSNTAWEANTWADVPGGGGAGSATGSRYRLGYRYTWASLLFVLIWCSHG